jgi:hypothetical protein
MILARLMLNLLILFFRFQPLFIYCINKTGSPEITVYMRIRTDRQFKRKLSPIFLTKGQDYPSLTPSFLRNHIIPHQFVKPDWKRFKPTNPVNNSQYPECTSARIRLNNTNVPAISLNARLIVHIRYTSI